MTRDRKIVRDRTTSTHCPSKAIVRFAPNFTVYHFPPDTVCLYSEHRKYFLYGALYCALAARIAAAGRTIEELIRELSGEFPSEKIQEAVKRLIDRRFVLLGTRPAAGLAAAYWSSIGLAPEAAETNLQQSKVRIQSIGVPGADELGAALAEMGVRVVKRAAGFTVVLVSDYLEPQLAELNRVHLSENTSWLLCQPSGIFPLVGPIFRPGKSACWTCLSDRMKRNREIKAFLDRRQARCLVSSPLASGILGGSAIQLAAIEIAKAIATDFRTDLLDHLISFDLLGSTLARHYVAQRPQCPSCGRKELQDPSRAAVPVELTGVGKLVMTSGGYRAVSPTTTLARFRKHVSPLTGVVSRLERIEADLPLNTSYVASHNFSPRPETVDELKSGLSGDSYGKGSTAEQGEASALMEAIERYSGIFQGNEIRVTKRFTDFGPGEAIAPNDVMLFSELQYRRGRDTAGEDDDGSTVPTPFNEGAEIEWSPVWSLRDKRFRYLPTSLLYYFHKGAGADQTTADSNGCAAGNTFEEAIVQGFLELVERDAYAIWWYNRLQRPALNLDQIEDSFIRDLRSQLTESGRRLWVLDITSDLRIPTYVAISHWTEGSQEHLEFGSGAHFDTRIAALRAITELNQFFSIGLMARRNAQNLGHDISNPWRLEDHTYLMPTSDDVVPSEPGSQFGSLDQRDQVLACAALAKQMGLDFLVLDQTRPDIGVPVSRVIVPGLRHFYRRFGLGRLYDVPVKLGLRDRPVAEDELNPLFPPA